jgi:hypothetical protein
MAVPAEWHLWWEVESLLQKEHDAIIMKKNLSLPQDTLYKTGHNVDTSL